MRHEQIDDRITAFRLWVSFKGPLEEFQWRRDAQILMFKACSDHSMEKDWRGTGREKKIRPAQRYLLSLKRQVMVARIRLLVVGQEGGHI